MAEDTGELIPLTEESLSPKFLLHDMLNDVDDTEAIAIVRITKDGTIRSSHSCPKAHHLHSMALALLHSAQRTLS